VIGADRSTGDDINKVLVLEGNVVVTQGTMRITAAKVTIQEDAKKNKFYVATVRPSPFARSARRPTSGSTARRSAPSSTRRTTYSSSTRARA
jgi:lipopolysaccharide transport protein LptA